MYLFYSIIRIGTLIIVARIIVIGSFAFELKHRDSLGRKRSLTILIACLINEIVKQLLLIKIIEISLIPKDSSFDLSCYRTTRIMLSPVSLMAKDMKYGQSSTPIMYPRNNLKPPSRKLWQKENLEPDADQWSEYRTTKWDTLNAPRFVNFSNLPDHGDSFFDNVTVIVSTPKPDFENSKLPNSVSKEEDEDETLIASFSNVNLSCIKYEPINADQVAGNGEDMMMVEECEKSVIQRNCIDNNVSKGMTSQEKNDKNEKCTIIKKPQATLVHPFTFDMRDKYKQGCKQERINKMLEEEKKNRVFRAKPVPKFLKTRPIPTNKNNNDKHSENNNEVYTTTDKKVKKPEVWKKPPFVPCLPKECTRPKTPPLRTAVRAQQRKNFDDTIKEKQKQKEQAIQMQIAAKKKQEEEEIARLRKQTVHKPQPIPKYKLRLPKIEKRPLTEPMTPLSFKRRRRA
ncbi:uncharacterized protein LOC143180092 [Calliopsis andreniformis]|uniref:uncharacterized protein LOC143180092 n=1 Tax=Calliopsis andreniformis TaxID=337506 RepID=UPI003FCCBFB9